MNKILNNKNIKVTFILHLPPPVHGASVVGKLIQNSHSINSKISAKYINLSTSVKLNEIGKRDGNKIIRFVLIVRDVIVHFIHFKPQLCYMTISLFGRGFYKDAVIAIIIKVFGIKTVYHFHNKGIKANQENWYVNILYKIVFSGTDVILLSKYLYQDCQKYFPEANVHYCPNGLQLRKTQTCQITKPYNKANVKILFLSNLIRSKGLFTLIEALSILKANNVPFKCDLIGGEGDINANQLYDVVKQLDLIDDVSYLGEKYLEEKQKSYIDADIFVLPTFNDCFPLVLIEAMQYSLPIVSTIEGGIPDMVEDGVTGFLIPPNNADVLAAKIELMIKNPALREQMGQAGRKKYEQEFTLNKFEERLKGILYGISKYQP